MRGKAKQGRSHPKSYEANSPESDQDGSALKLDGHRGPIAPRSRGVLPPQEVFKNIVFDDSEKGNMRNSSPGRQQSQLPNELISPQYSTAPAQTQQNSIKLSKSQSMT